MGADKVIFSVRYAERNESRNWDRLKYDVAEFIAGVFCNCPPEKSFLNVLRLGQQHEKAVDWLDDGLFPSEYVLLENKEKRFCEITDNDFTGGIDSVCINIKNWLPVFYPELDWEFHYYERYGEVYDQVIISVGGKQYSGDYEILLCPDEDFLAEEYKEWEEAGNEGEPPPKTFEEWYDSIDFSIPQPTANYPYPIPKYVLDEYDAGDKVYYWACDQFQGEVVPCSNTRKNTDQKKIIEDAKKGEPFEQLDLGIRLITGDGIESDAEKGIELLRKASAKGEEYSKRLLAFYDDPERYYQAALTEIKKKQSADEKKIFKLMEKAAEGGHHSAKCDLGVFLLTDYSGKWDYNKGIELLRQAEEHGNEKAKSYLQKYITPDGMCWSAMAKILRNLKTGQNDYKEALKLLEKSAAQGSAVANCNMGILSCADENNSFGIERSIETAKEYFRRAAELGDETALKIKTAIEEQETAKVQGATDKLLKVSLRMPKLN